MREQWLNRIQDRLKGYERKAPEGLLDDIKNEMASRDIVPGPYRKLKTSTLLLRFSAAAAAIIAAGLFLWTEFPIKKGENHNVAIEERQTAIGNRNSASPAGSTISDVTDRHTHTAVSTIPDVTGYATAATENVAYIPLGRNKGKLETSPSPKKTNEKSIRDSSRQEVQKESADEHLQGGSEDIPKRSNIDDDDVKSENGDFFDAYGTKAPEKTRKAISKIGIGTFYGGTRGYGNDANGLLLASADPIGAYAPEMSGINSEKQLYKSSPLETRTRYHQNFKFGISANCVINDRWSLQSGVTYTFLSSNITRSNNVETYDTDQKLHYLGIPVSASFRLWKVKDVNIYAIAGGAIDILVKGKAETEYASGHVRQVSTEKISDGRPWFSVNCALGAEYPVTKRIGIYAEPGISHYFNNGSGIDNIYEEKPTNFHFNIGLRVNIGR